MSTAERSETDRHAQVKPLAVNETIAIAYTFSGTRDTAIYHGECGGSNLAAERALRKLAAKLGVKLQDLHICYEAGPTVGAGVSQQILNNGGVRSIR